MFGFLNIDKPVGITSRDAVNIVQRLVRPAKVGHAGTLDPLATGVLVIGIGYATRLFDHLQRLPKRYRVTFRFGVRSNTDDLEGMLEEVPAPAFTREQLEGELSRWRGAVQQVPPAFSAAKVKGQRAYQLARRGEQLDLAPRTVTIHELEIERFEFPELVLSIACSSGTYIRSLGRDIAEGLGTRAVMTSLNRTSIGPFGLYDAIPIDRIDANSVTQFLLPPTMALADLPKIGLDPAQVVAAFQGRSMQLQLPVVESAERGELPGEMAAIDQDGTLVAILKRVNGDQWRADRCFGR